MRSVKALVVLTAGFALGVLPAMGASHEIKDSGSTWSPSTLTIEAGDDVKWNWAGFHNVRFEDGTRSGDPQLGGSFEKTFATPGTFKFRCEQHSADFSSGMVGTITVNQAGTGTTGTDTTGTGTTPTNTTPTNTTPTTTTQTDSTGPEITSLRRRASRRVLRISFTSDEDGSVEATIRRRNPGARAFRLVGSRTASMVKGSNVVTLQRAPRGLRRGAYRVRLVFLDESANESRARTLVFKIA